MIEELFGPECHGSRNIAIVQETLQLGMMVSHVTRFHGVNANQIFVWRQRCQKDNVTTIMTGKDAVSAS